MEQPCDITSLPDNRIAVTTTTGKIMFFKIAMNGFLKLEKELCVSEGCFGIEYVQGQLFVTYVIEDSRIEILDLDGNIVRVIDVNGNGERLFSCPYAICTSVEQEIVYVADWLHWTISVFTANGELIKQIHDEENLAWPRSIVIGYEGRVLVFCGGVQNVCDVDVTSDSVVSVTISKKNATVIGEVNVSDDSFECACFLPQTNEVWVGKSESSHVNVYSYINVEKKQVTLNGCDNIRSHFTLFTIVANYLVASGTDKNCFHCFDVDTLQNAFCDRLKASPNALTAVDGRAFAVALSNGNIQIYSLKNGNPKCLSQFHAGSCLAMASLGTVLFISQARTSVGVLRPKADVKILDMSGNVLKRLENFSRPVFMATNHQDKCVHVSDWFTNRLESLSPSGDGMGVPYRSRDLQYIPQCIAVEKHGGTFMYAGKSVHLHLPLQFPIVLLETDEVVDDPTDMVFCDITQTLFVSSKERKTLDLYKIAGLIPTEQFK